MKFEPIFEWDSENGIASCILTIGNNTFYGTAKCHKMDLDMMSEKTGCDIAYRRAVIKYYQHVKAILKERLFALNQLYYAMKDSKKFNEKSYENRSLQKQIRFTKSDLDTIKEMIANEKQSLKTFIDKKAEFYYMVHMNRIRRKEMEEKANLNK